MLDGAEHTNRFDQTGMPMPFPDSLQEFRVSTSSQEADTGRASGASVNAVTRSGTNQFHGDLFWFGRNAKIQRPQGRRHPRRRTEAEPAWRRDRRTDRTEPAVLLRRLPEHGARSGAVGHAVDRADRGDAGRRLDGVQPVLPSDVARHRFRRRRRQPDAHQPRGAGSWRPGCRTPSNACGEVRWGDRDRAARQADGLARRLPAHRQPSIFGRYMGTLHDQPVPFGQDPSNLLSTTEQRLQRSASLDGRSATRWVINPTIVNSFRVAYNRLGVNKAGARFFSPEDVGIAQWTSVPGHFVLTVPGVLHPRQRTDRQARDGAEPVSDQQRHRTLTRGTHQFGIGGIWGRRRRRLAGAHPRRRRHHLLREQHRQRARRLHARLRSPRCRQSMPSTLSPYAALRRPSTRRTPGAPRPT